METRYGIFATLTNLGNDFDQKWINELEISQVFYYRSNYIYSGSLEDCQEKINIFNKLPFKIGQKLKDGHILSFYPIELDSNRFIITFYGYIHKSPILGSEILFQIIFNSKEDLFEVTLKNINLD